MASIIIRNAWIRPGSHSNLKLDTTAGLTVGSTVAVGPKYNAVIEMFLPYNQIRVRTLPLAAPGSFGLIFRKGVTVA
jgi:hypothetical protein